VKKIIVRKKIMPAGYVNSTFIEFCKDKQYKSLNEFLIDYNSNDIIRKLFSEEIESNDIKDSELYRLYNLALESGIDNECFKIMYLIDDEFAVHLTQNIYLYHIATSKEDIYSTIVPWYYADSENYIGDTWWEEDTEIIENLNKLSIIEFYKRYKGY